LTGVSVGDLGLGCLPVAGFTTDFDGQTRNAGWHYMGADEVLGAPLPVELSAFNAKAISNDVPLTWTTASETNNSHFEILRSADGVSFSSIKNVKGKGTTTRASAYTELDADANKYAQNNKLYYQLKQVDLDGKNTYSDIVCVLFGQPVSDQVTVFPNPTQDVATILFSEMNAGVVDYQITDIHGKTLLSGQTWVKDYALQIESVQNLPHGIYFVQLNTQKVSHTMKLIKD
jgi:hypothetical protein